MSQFVADGMLHNMKKTLTIIGIVLIGLVGWFLTEKPNPPFGAIKTNLELAQDCVKIEKINRCIGNLTAGEKANLKGQEISKIGLVSRTNVKFSEADYDIQIVETKFIEGGVEILARAWDSQSQIGFGKDGTVDMERFIIINPPILIDDPVGNIIRELTDRDGSLKQRKLREDIVEATLQGLAHTIKVKKERFGSSKIIPGKVGNTTSTFYPDPNIETTTVDGYVGNTGENTTFAGVREGAGDVFEDSGAIGEAGEIDCSGTGGNFSAIYRGIYLYNTGPTITNTNTISSATMSLIGNGKSNTAGHASPENDLTIVTLIATIPASNVGLANSDFNIAGWTMTQQNSTDILYDNFSTSVYNDFALNATGIGNISKTGVTKFGAVMAADRTGTITGCTAGGTGFATTKSADTAGTTSDPKLVVEHSESGRSNRSIIQ